MNYKIFNYGFSVMIYFIMKKDLKFFLICNYSLFLEKVLIIKRYFLDMLYSQYNRKKLKHILCHNTRVAKLQENSIYIYIN